MSEFLLCFVLLSEGFQESQFSGTIDNKGTESSSGFIGTKTNIVWKKKKEESFAYLEIELTTKTGTHHTGNDGQIATGNMGQSFFRPRVPYDHDETSKGVFVLRFPDLNVREISEDLWHPFAINSDILYLPYPGKDDVRPVRLSGDASPPSPGAWNLFFIRSEDRGAISGFFPSHEDPFEDSGALFDYFGQEIGSFSTKSYSFYGYRVIFREVVCLCNCCLVASRVRDIFETGTFLEREKALGGSHPA